MKEAYLLPKVNIIELFNPLQELSFCDTCFPTFAYCTIEATQVELWLNCLNSGNSLRFVLTLLNQSDESRDFNFRTRATESNQGLNT